MSYRPVDTDARGRFQSLTPMHDKAIESLMDEIAVRRTRAAQIEQDRQRILDAYEQRKVLCIDEYRRPAQKTKPPKQAA